MTAIFEDNVDEVTRLIQDGLYPNVRFDEGAPALHGAILRGNITIIRLLLEHGANPNLIADEPAASVLTANPLELAMQARHLMDFEKYDPVVKLLEEFGATDAEGLFSAS